MIKILFQGDSITDAGRSREMEFMRGCGYPCLVASKLGFENPNEYEFLNRGISGNRITDLFARIKQDIINLKPDVLSILIGINDVWHDIVFQNGVKAELFEEIYGILIREIKEALPDVRIIIMEPFALKGSSTEERWEEFKAETKLRAEASKRVAEKYSLEFIPLQDKFDEAEKLADASYWIRDGVHPTSAGHELITREWVKQFKSK